MDLKTFKRKLGAYGADFARWDGVNEEEARAFMAQSDEARSLHRQAEKLDRALDSFSVTPPRHAIMGGVQSRIGAVGGDKGKIMPFPLRIETPPWKVAVGMGMAAAAAMVLLVFATLRDESSVLPRGGSSVSVVAEANIAGQAQIDSFIAEISSFVEEDEEAEKIFAMLDPAAAGGGEQEVEKFLDDLYANREQDTDNAPESMTDASPEDPGIWEVFYPVTESP